MRDASCRQRLQPEGRRVARCLRSARGLRQGQEQKFDCIEAAEADEDVAQQRWWMWGLPVLLLATATLVVPLRILESAGLPRYRVLRAEKVRIERHNQEIQRQIRTLRSQVAALRHDRQAIERIARDELGMVRPGERVVQFQPPCRQESCP